MARTPGEWRHSRLTEMREAVNARLEDMPFRTGVVLALSALLVLGAATAAVILAVIFVLHSLPSSSRPQPQAGRLPAATSPGAQPASTRTKAGPSGARPGGGQPGQPGATAGEGHRGRAGLGATRPGRRGGKPPTRPHVTVATHPDGVSSSPLPSLAAAPDPANPGQTVTYLATVTPASSRGWVAFTSGGNVLSGCGRVAIAGGRARCRESYSGVGAHLVTAVYHAPGGRVRSAAPVGETIARCGRSYQGCSLLIANLERADLRGANLARATLQSADLAGANLAGADLAGVNLAGADLAGASLQGANLSNASLAGASLQRANLDGVHWSNTSCPDGTNSNRHHQTCRGNL